MRAIVLVLAASVLGACSTQEIKIAHSVPLVTAEAPPVEASLLDVGVLIFDSGVPEGEIDRDTLEELMRDGTFVQIRRTEAMFLANQLKLTLQRSGHWGAVYVTPRESTAVDLNIRTEILQSDGYILAVGVNATDSAGRVWLDKDYDMETAASAYNRQRYPTLDPYQDVFNEIANDLTMIRAGLGGGDLAEIRTIGDLRFAAEMSPESFDGYVEENSRGEFSLVRLPAVDDPQFRFTQSMRQSEQLLFETLDQHYQNFTLDASDSYGRWREYSREDSIRVQEAARSAKLRTGLGALAIALSIAYSQSQDGSSIAESIVSNSGLYIGTDMLRSAALRRQERRLHTQSLQELSESFDDEVKPTVIEVQGTQRRLIGTTEVQYEEWRRYLRELYRSENGLAPEEIEIYVEPEPEPAEAETAAPDIAISPNTASESEEATADDSGGAPAQV